MNYHAISASNKIAKERKQTFDNFENSKYATGEYFDKYTQQTWAPATPKVKELFKKAGVAIPTQEDWAELKKSVMKHGIYNQNLQAVPPTGSISYINNSTSSIHPIASRIEVRKEGKLGVFTTQPRTSVRRPGSTTRMPTRSGQTRSLTPTLLPLST